jgi:hypothetical protein
MTDEEMAEEYADEKCKDCYMCSYSEHKNPYKICQRRKDVKQAFLAGLKAGRPQWHDLRKNPNDLPEDGRIVSDQEGNNVRYVERLNKWFYRHRTCKANVIAWCEIPTFDKE